MANENGNYPFGFEPYTQDGKEVRVNYYTKKTGAAINKGDLVIQDAAGNVTIAGTSGTCLGVAAEYKASADVTKIAVYDDPEQRFVAKVSGAAFAAADRNLNANWAVGTAANRQSGGSINMSTADVTSTLQVKLLDLLDRGDNVVGDYSQVICKINNHAFRTGVAGI